ncbi:MAG TPA: hypothetical protein VHV32_19275 [Candidatus Angelobacter sp.]|jgi:hypothetical protein|nr:hypothetical protein [Candidatus Angelobacter sp.]
MGFIPSSPDVEVGLLQSATLPHSFRKCELIKADKSLKNVNWTVLFGTRIESQPPIVGRFVISGETVVVCLFHLPEVSYLFPRYKNGIAVEMGTPEEAKDAFLSLSKQPPLGLRAGEQKGTE